jgi:hypothetical protein
MDDSSAGIVLHEAKTTFLLWVIPVFVVMGCVLVGVNVWLPLLSRPAGEASAGLWVPVALAILAGLAIPVGAGLMFFLIPRITTRLDPQRRVVAMEFRRPLGRSVKEYALENIAEVAPVYVRRRSLVLKSGENVRLDYRLLPTAEALQPQAEKIMGQLGPYLTRSAGAA